MDQRKRPTFVAPSWSPDRSYGSAQQANGTCMAPLPWPLCVGVHLVVFRTPRWTDVKTLSCNADSHVWQWPPPLATGKTVPKMKLGVWTTAVHHSPSSVCTTAVNRLQVVYVNHVQPCSVISCYNIVNMQHLHLLTFPSLTHNCLGTAPCWQKNVSLKLWLKSPGKNTLYMTMATMKNIKLTEKLWQQIPTIAVCFKINSIVISKARSGRQNYAVRFRTLGTYKII